MNPRLAVCATVALLPVAGLLSQSPIVINEFSYDDVDPESYEFVELYNAGGSTVDISCWTVDSLDGTGLYASYVIPPSTTLPAGGHYTLVHTLLITSVPPPVQDIGSGNRLLDGHAAIALCDAASNVIDTVVYEAANGLWVGGGSPAEGRPIYGAFLNDDSLPTSWSRLRDGHDTDDNGLDFRIMPATPGATNDVASLLPLSEDFDALPVDSAVPFWSGSVEPPYVVNPLVAGGQNPKSVPQSPQGGNAMVLTAPSGTGRSYMLVNDAEDRMGFSAWVYLDKPPPANPGHFITWSLGVRGTTDSNYALPDPERLGSVDQNGDTGLTWTYHATSTGSTLWLVDNWAGGTNHVVLARIVAPTQGWHRISIGGTGRGVRALFDGAEYGSSSHETEGSVYFGIATSSPGGGPYAAYVDDEDIKPPAYTANPNNPACLGNCPPVNESAENLADRPPETATYAFLVDNTENFNLNLAFQADGLCVYTEHLMTLALSPTVAVHAVDISGEPESVPMTAHGAFYPLEGILPLPSSYEGPEWVAAPTNNGGPWRIGPVPSFFVVVDLTERIKVPICFDLEDGATLKTPIAFTGSPGSWTPVAGNEAWTLRWQCDMESDLENVADGPVCFVGATVTITLSNGPANAPALSALSLASLNPPLLLPFIGTKCRFYCAPPSFNTFVTLSPAGSFAIPISIPNDPAYSGLKVFSQWVVIDPSTTSGYDLSPLAWFVIG